MRPPGEDPDRGASLLPFRPASAQHGAQEPATQEGHASRISFVNPRWPSSSAPSAVATFSFPSKLLIQ